MIQTVLLLSSLLMVSEQTRELSVSGSREVLEGDPETASVDAHGQIGMGPTLVELGKPTDKPITTLIAGPQGSILAGTAGGGILRIDASGKSTVLAKSEEIVTALASVNGKILAGLSSGRVVSVGADGKLN